MFIETCISTVVASIFNIITRQKTIYMNIKTATLKTRKHKTKKKETYINISINYQQKRRRKIELFLFACQIQFIQNTLSFTLSFYGIYKHKHNKIIKLQNIH